MKFLTVSSNTKNGLGMYPTETKLIFMQDFGPNFNLPKCTSVEEWLKKPWYSVEHYFAIKEKKILGMCKNL